MKKGWMILIGVIAITLVLGIGAAAGGAVTFVLLRDDLPKAFAAPWVDEVNNDDLEGEIVARVPGSAAEKAGLVRGDIILEVNDKPVNSFQALLKVIKPFDPGDSVTLTILHGDETRSLDITLGEKDGLGFLGISPCIGESFGDYDFNKDFHITINAGVLVTEVIKDSPADLAGIEAGDTIISVDKEDISTESSLAELIKAHKPGDKVKLVISRDGKKKIFNLDLGENPGDAGQAYLGIYYTSALDHMIFDFKGNEQNFEMPNFDFKGEGGKPFFQHKIPGFWGLESLPEGYQTAIIISEVVDGTPAKESGLQVKDLILELNDRAVESFDDFVEEIKSFDPGDGISLLVYREGEKIEVDIIVGENPEKPGMGYLGIKVSGFLKITIEGDLPEEFEFDLEKELELPGGGA